MSYAVYLETAVTAARAAGQLLREHFGRPAAVNEFADHDIKLELDVRAQTLIEKILAGRHPDHSILGEEGSRGPADHEFEWVVDPLDGTVNYFYGVPHFSVSVALRHRAPAGAPRLGPAGFALPGAAAGQRDELVVGVIYDPLREELWSVSADEAHPTTLNGQPVRVSARARLADTIVSVGLSKSPDAIGRSLPVLYEMIHRVRKCRLMGSAALDLAYVATGRLDAYLESAVNLWDIAAGALLVARAGGRMVIRPRPDQPDKLTIAASSGLVAELAELPPGLLEGEAPAPSSPSSVA